MIKFSDFVELFLYLLAHMRIPAYSPIVGVDEGSHRFIDIEKSHSYLIGKTGSGKSFLLLQMIFHLIIKGKSGAFIDPYGEAFQNLSSLVFFYEACRNKLAQFQEIAMNYLLLHAKDLRKCHESELEKDLHQKLLVLKEIVTIDLNQVFPSLNVVIVDCSKQANDFAPNPHRINPFALGDNESISELVNVFLGAIQRHTGQDSNETPQLASILEAVTSYGIVEEKEFADIREILSELEYYAGQGTGKAPKMPPDFLNTLLENSDETAKQAGFYLNNQLLRFPKNEFFKNINSTVNRLRFLYNQTVFNLLDTSTTTLDLEKLINSDEERKPFILFHIPSDQKGGDFLASYLLNKIEHIIFRRNAKQKKKPFHLFIDEFFEFADDSICKNFAKVRQFGLRYIVAHQTIDQLKKDDNTGFRLGTVFKNCANKIIFNVVGDDALYMAESCFPITGQMPHITFTKSQTNSRGEAESRQVSISEMSGEALAESNSESLSSQTSLGRSTNRGISVSHSEGFVVGQTKGRGLNYTLENGMIANSASSQNRATSNSKSQNQTHSEASNNSFGESQQNSKGRSSTTGTTKTHNSSKTNTKGTTHTANESHSIGQTENLGHYTVSEEIQFLAQEIKKLEAREFFLCTEGLCVHKLKTLEALLFKIEESLKVFLEDNFYPCLYEFQKRERHKIELLLKQEEKLKPVQEFEEFDGVFNI